MCENHHNLRNLLYLRIYNGKSTRFRYNLDQFLSKFET